MWAWSFLMTLWLPKAWVLKTPSGINKNHWKDRMNPNWQMPAQFWQLENGFPGISQRSVSQSVVHVPPTAEGLGVQVQRAEFWASNGTWVSRGKAWECAFRPHSRGFWCRPSIENCQLRKSVLTCAPSCPRALHWTPVLSLAVVLVSVTCRGPARTRNFLGSQRAGGTFYGRAFNEGPFPFFIYITVYIVHYFSHKSTSVSHFVICLFLEMKCDYIKQCSHKNPSYSSHNCLETCILTAFPQQCIFGTQSVMKA